MLLPAPTIHPPRHTPPHHPRTPPPPPTPPPTPPTPPPTRPPCSTSPGAHTGHRPSSTVASTAPPPVQWGRGQTRSTSPDRFSFPSHLKEKKFIKRISNGATNKWCERRKGKGHREIRKNKLDSERSGGRRQESKRIPFLSPHTHFNQD